MWRTLLRNYEAGKAIRRQFCQGVGKFSAIFPQQESFQPEIFHHFSTAETDFVK